MKNKQLILRVAIILLGLASAIFFAIAIVDDGGARDYIKALIPLVVAIFLIFEVTKKK